MRSPAILAAALAAVLATGAAAAQEDPAADFTQTWERTAFSGCIETLAAGTRFAPPDMSITGMRMDLPRVESETWRDTAGWVEVEIWERPVGEWNVRRYCDVNAARELSPDQVALTLAQFDEWIGDASEAGRFAPLDRLRPREDGTDTATAISTRSNPRGCRVTVTALAMPTQGYAALSAVEIGEPGCGGPSLLGGNG